MTALRELAERWKAHADVLAARGNMFNGGTIMTKQECAAELLSILDAEGDGGAVSWRETIMSVLSALDVATGDTDPNIDPDMTDDDVRDEYPEVWAMQKLSGLLATHPQPARSGVLSDEQVEFDEGDLFWPDDDGEDCAESMFNLLESLHVNGQIEPGQVVRVRRARNLPSVEVTITTFENGDFCDYKLAAIKSQGESNV